MVERNDGDFYPDGTAEDIEMANNNELLIVNEAEFVPPGLRGDGEHYINTGFHVTNTTRIELLFMVDEIPSQYITAHGIFGAGDVTTTANDSTRIGIQRVYSSGSYKWFLFAETNMEGELLGEVTVGHIYSLIYDYSLSEVWLDGVKTSIRKAYSTLEVQDEAYLFGWNVGYNSRYRALITVGQMNIYDGDVLVRSYSPVEENNIAGLYDAVSDEFNAGKGTGAFEIVTRGVLFDYKAKDIISLEGQTAVNIVGEELSIDTLSAVVHDYGEQENVSNVVNVKYGTPIYWLDGTYLRGKFYTKKVTRIGKNKYKIDAISAIGLLDKIQHQGGVYYRERFDRILKDILARGTSNRRIGLGYEEYEYITKTNSGSTISIDDASNSLEVVVTVKLPSTLSAGVKYALFGVTNGSNHYTLSVTGSQSDNQRAYGTNLYAELGVSAYWAGENQLPYLQPGSTHRLGFKGYLTTDSANRQYYHLDLYCDGVLYEGSIPNTTTFNTSAPVYLLAEYNSGVRNAATGFSISRYESWKSGVKIKDIVFAEQSNLLNYAVPYNMITNNTTGTVVNGFTLGPKRDIGDQTPVVPYTIEQSALASLTVSGYLPTASKRENLYQLLFATNANLVKNIDGSLIFKWLNDNNPEPIVDSNIYLEGEVEYPAEVSEVAVTEHTYVGSDGSVQNLFETEEAVLHKQVYFSNAPIYIPSIEAGAGLTLEYATVNYAIVSGSGKLTGCKYLHNATVNSAKNPDADEGKVVEVKDATLVSPLTSVNVRDRLLQFYKSGIKVRNSIILGDRTAGKPYTFNNPFKEFVTGILEKLEIIVSAKTKAEAEFCVGYQPNGSGGIYTHSQTITNSGSYTFPEGVTSAKVILVGGGDGGYGGSNGTEAEDGNSYCSFDSVRGGHGGLGGAGGQPGNVGKVFSFDLSDRLTHSFNITIGSGGTGGRAGNAGSSGSATKIKDLSDNTEWTSESGQRGAYVNPISGAKYALPGSAGVAGGNGGSSNGFTQNPQPGQTATIGNGVLGPDNTQYQGGYAGQLQYSYNQYSAGGGCGGGAAVGNSGSNGTNGYYYYFAEFSDYDIHGGAGGAGANAIARNETPSYGQGGNGGHGGGGGGAGGDAWGNPASEHYLAFEGNGGSGGTGGAGGAGGNGCVIILY